MEKIKKSKSVRFWSIFVFNIFLLLGIGYLFFLNTQTLKILTQKPTDIEVVNITNSNAWIYWKAPQEGLHTLLFKKISDIGEFEEVENIGIGRDIVDQKRVYFTNIDNLEPDTQYEFQIVSEDNVWDSSNSFKTKQISQEIELPEVVTGVGDKMSLLLIEMDGEKLMIDTQYHGTYAFDSKGKEFVATKYSTYISENQLKEKLSLLLSSPIFAATGANCQTNIGVNTSGFVPSKAKVIDIVDRWVGSCPLGGYPEVCYEDVYCKALSLGIEPAFLITIWSHESGGSNYAFLPVVEDFGIHNNSNVPVADFTKQITYFSNVIAQPSSISSCKWVGPEPTSLSKEMVMWGARYLRGSCDNETALAAGQGYMDEINKIYGWYTNESLTWPFIRSKNTSTCDYTDAKTNVAYNSCTQKGPITPPVNPSVNPTVGDGIKKWLPITGIYDEGNTISPEVDIKCEDIDGCSCIWKYNIKPGESTKNANNGQTCTVAGQVIDKSPVAPPVNPPVTPPVNPPVGDGIKKWLPITGIYDEGNTISPEVDKACDDVDGCTCIWKYNIKPGESTKNANNGQTCTVAGEVIQTPPLQKECCISNQSVSLVEKGSCTGKVLTNVENSKCISVNSKINIKEGTNFIQALELINSQDVPISSAKNLIEYSQGKILVVGEFLNNEWIKVVKYSNGTINGQDFNLDSGKIYLVISTQDIEIPIKSVTVPIVRKDLTKLIGWNLIPSLYFEGIAKFTTDILTDDDYEYISQVAIWDDELSSFKYTIEDLTVQEGVDKMFGPDYDIYNQQGIFIRVSN